LRGLRALLTEPGAVLLLRETATELGLHPGATLDLKIGGVHRPARLSGLIEAGDAASRRALEGLIVSDVATAQELTGRNGRLMLEGVALGALATVLGLLLGLALARGLVALVARTINDLYFALAVRDLAVPPGVFAKGALLGVGGTLGATVLPALEATTAPPGSG